MNIAPNKPLPVQLQDASEDDRRLLKIHERFLMDLAGLESITVLATGTEPPPSAMALLGTMKILVPMAGLIDVAAEQQRLKKNRQRANDALSQCENKLAKKQFRANAPVAVVAKEKAKLERLQQEITQLDDQLARLNQLGGKSGE